MLWRFFEAITGQGYDDTMGSWKNFFKYRVSPAVSGIVYATYLGYILALLGKGSSSGGGGSGGGGSVLMQVILGIAFLAAAITQAIPAIKGTFRRDLSRRRLDRWHPPHVRRAVYTLGHIGFAGRGLLFLFLAIMFFRVVFDSASYQQNSPLFQAGLEQLTQAVWLRVILFIVGLMVLIYGLFAILNAYFKIFPTPAPSRLSAAEGV